MWPQTSCALVQADKKYWYRRTGKPVLAVMKPGIGGWEPRYS